MAASLPMYDLPCVREHTRSLLTAVTDHLDAEPAEHQSASDTQQATSDLLWDDEHLAVSQMCGLALYDRMQAAAEAGTSPRLCRLATPVYTAEGCGPSGTYCGMVVVAASAHADGSYAELADLAGVRLAINHPDSYSGCVGLCAAVSDLFNSAAARPSRICFFASSVCTGSHRASLAAVTSGAVEAACIDCVTWALLQRHAPLEVQDVHVIGCTPSAPAPPFVGQSAANAARTDHARRVLGSLGAGAGSRDAGAGTQPVLSPQAMEACAALLLDRVLVGGGSGVIGSSHLSGSVQPDLAAFGDLRRRALRAPLLDPQATAAAGFFERLDASAYSFDVGAVSAEAQRWFDRGMLLLWGAGSVARSGIRSAARPWVGGIYGGWDPNGRQCMPAPTCRGMLRSHRLRLHP